MNHYLKMANLTERSCCAGHLPWERYCCLKVTADDEARQLHFQSESYLESCTDSLFSAVTDLSHP